MPRSAIRGARELRGDRAAAYAPRFPGIPLAGPTAAPDASPVRPAPRALSVSPENGALSTAAATSESARPEPFGGTVRHPPPNGSGFPSFRCEEKRERERKRKNGESKPRPVHRHGARGHRPPPHPTRLRPPGP
ncbi:hypothetical protein GCM10017688_30300 [Streptomyces ramulosus]